MRMNHPIFYSSKVYEDPKEFIEVVYKALTIMGVSVVGMEESTAYQFKSVAQMWNPQ